MYVALDGGRRPVMDRVTIFDDLRFCMFVRWLLYVRAEKLILVDVVGRSSMFVSDLWKSCQFVNSV